MAEGQADSMELRQLGYFVVACQSPNLIAAATELGIAQSTLSAGLQSLEDQIGLPLFRQTGKRIFPQPAAVWLFRHAVALLHIESFARAFMATPDGATPGRIAIDLHLSFAIGRLSKALGHAVEALRTDHPDLLFDYHFRLGPDDGTLEASPAGERIAPETRGVVEIDMIDPTRSGDDGMIPLVEDPWMMVSLTRPLVPPETLPLHHLRMADRLDRALTWAAEAGGFTHRLVRLGEDPTRLSRLMMEQPQAIFVLPRSMLANRLGLFDVHVEPLTGAAGAWIGARVRQPHPAVDALIATLRVALADKECNVVFRPHLTLRQLRYFQLLDKSGGISAAARAANVTQPAVTAQLRKLEQVLARPLYRIEGGGLAINAAGARLCGIVVGVDLRLKEIAEGRSAVAGARQDVLRVGIVPVADSGSMLADAVARVVAKLRRDVPGLMVQIVEAHTRLLHDLVQNGSVPLAIVETVNTQTARIPLGQFEPLAVVANVALGLDGSPVPLARLKDLPLVLCSPSFGLRAQIDHAAHEAGVRLKPCAEVDSLTLTLAMVQQDALCTVLPPRAARVAPLRDTLTVSTLIEPTIRQSLNAIFSARHELSAVERAFVTELKAQLREVLSDPA
jgi:DNA-binding transcriptional LysR family regulator